MNLETVKERIRGYWDGQAKEYDGRRHREHGERQREHWSRILSEALGGSPLRVLDAGTGTGTIALLLAGLGHDVTGIDVAADMLAVARRDVADSGLAVEILERDAEETEFDDEEFDAVVSRHLLWTLPRPGKAVDEWRRILRPGGVLLVLDGDWSVPRAEGKIGSLDAYRELGIEDSLPMQRLPRPAADVELLRRSGFHASSFVLDMSGHAGSAMRNARRFVVHGVKN